MPETKNKIPLGVVLDACDFPDEVDQDCQNNDVSTHYDGSYFRLDWDDEYSTEQWPNMMNWLVETYGEDIKKYTGFCVSPT